MVRDAMLNMGCLPVVQEHFSPDYRDVSSMLRSRISECDALIHIAGVRYGAEPAVDTIPPGEKRRSFTQMEVDLARELNLEKVFTFVCPPAFPYDSVDCDGNELVPESGELRELQQAHREQLLLQKELHYKSDTPEDLALKVREIQLELAQVKGELKRSRGKMIAVGIGMIFALLLVVGGVLHLMRGQKEQEFSIKDAGRQVEVAKAEISKGQDESAVRDAAIMAKQEDSDAELEKTVEKLERIAAVIEKIEKYQDKIATDIENFVSDSASREIDRGAHSAEEVEAIKNMRDQQIAQVSDTVRFVGSGLSPAADPVFVRAGEILVDQSDERGGPEKMLSYLNGQRERILVEVKAVDETAPEGIGIKRQKLKSILLQAKIHENAFEWEKAIECLTLVVGNEPTWWEPVYRLGVLVRERAVESAELAESEVYLRKSLSVASTALEKAGSLDELGILLLTMGRTADAERYIREALSIRLAELGEESEDSICSYNNLGEYLIARGDFSGASRILRKALDRAIATLGDEDSLTMEVRSNLATVLWGNGQLDYADAEFRKILSIAEKLGKGESPETLTVMNNLAGILSQRNQNEEAEILYRRVFRKRREILGEHHADTLNSMSNFGVFLQGQGRYEESDSFLNGALEGYRRVQGDFHQNTLTTKGIIAIGFELRGRYAEAEELYREVISEFANAQMGDHPDRIKTMQNLGAYYLSRRDYFRAEDIFEEVLVYWRSRPSENNPAFISAIANMAGAYMGLERYREAEALYGEAYQKHESVFGTDHADTQAMKQQWLACRSILGWR